MENTCIFKRVVCEPKFRIEPIQIHNISNFKTNQDNFYKIITNLQ